MIIKSERFERRTRLRVEGGVVLELNAAVVGATPAVQPEISPAATETRRMGRKVEVRVIVTSDTTPAISKASSHAKVE